MGSGSIPAKMSAPAWNIGWEYAMVLAHAESDIGRGVNHTPGPARPPYLLISTNFGVCVWLHHFPANGLHTDPPSFLFVVTKIRLYCCVCSSSPLGS